VTNEPTLDSIVTATLDSQLGELESRLVHDYGAERRSTVHALVEQEKARFADVRVHAFVPILMERSIRSRLAR
jgi:hypothetical protein